MRIDVKKLEDYCTANNYAHRLGILVTSGELLISFYESGKGDDKAVTVLPARDFSADQAGAIEMLKRKLDDSVHRGLGVCLTWRDADAILDALSSAPQEPSK